MSVEKPEQAQPEGADRSIDLSSLFQSLQGEGAGQDAGSPPDVSGLGGVLGSLLGQGMPEAEPVAQAGPDATGLAEGMGISPSVAQAALALVMGSLLRGESGAGSKGGGLAELLGQSGDQPLDEEAVKATGLPDQLSRSTGLDLPKAIQTVQQLLEMLRKATKPLGSAGAGTTARKKPKKPSSSTRPKAKPKKTTSSTRPKAKPKKTTGSTSSKTKPKKTTSSTRPKAKPKKTASTTAKQRKTSSKR